METAKKILGSLTIAQETAQDIKKNVGNTESFGKKINEYATRDTTSLLDALLFASIHLKASDIHLEPQQDNARLRVRLDGSLQDIAAVDRTIYQNLLSRLKLLSKLKLNVADRPQDGRFTIAAGEALIEIRTSTLPAEYGEAVVMRILDPQNLMELETLGLRKDLYELFLKEIARPNGMIVVTGPTGAGKTTTLYAFLMKVKNPQIKIITIEDPIEYHLEGVSQTQVAAAKGYSFSGGLRSIVRQDPDIILVGEIRDLETAKIALQAALTGHLVFSTLHTNDAAGTIPRLTDLGADPASIAPALKMVVGERLVRKVCKKCATLVKPTADELAEIKKGLHGIPKNIDIPKLAALKIAKAKEGGCPACNFTGYKGRKGIFEVFTNDDQMERFILTNPPVADIKKLLEKKGMVTMYQSGIIEVALQETTLQEVKRVVQAEE